MKAITIHQPWASLIAHGYKRYETRSWRTNYRGPIAIHAGKRMNQETVEMLRTFHPDILRRLKPIQTGSIIAVAELVDCWEVRSKVLSGGGIYLLSTTGEEAGVDIPEWYFGDFSAGRYAWELANVKLLPEPIPAKGQQGLWNWEGST